MIPEFESYCRECDDDTTWQLEDENDNYQVWECSGCGDTCFKPL